MMGVSELKAIYIQCLASSSTKITQPQKDLLIQGRTN